MARVVGDEVQRPIWQWHRTPVNLSVYAQGPNSAIIVDSCLGRQELSGEDSGGGSGSGGDGWGGGEESQLKPNFESIFKD